MTFRSCWVTLGGTGKQAGDRHPKIRHGVLIGAGAKILGAYQIGHAPASLPLSGPAVGTNNKTVRACRQ
jgi:hypothetical protein